GAPLAGRRAERRRALLRVEGQGPVEGRGEAREVDPARGDQRGAIADGHADRAAAEALRLELPAEGRLERLRRDPDRIAGDVGVELEDPAPVEEPKRGGHRKTSLGGRTARS